MFWWFVSLPCATFYAIPVLPRLRYTGREREIADGGKGKQLCSQNRAMGKRGTIGYVWSYTSSSRDILVVRAWWWEITENIRSARIADFGKTFTGVIHGVERERIYRLRMMAYSNGGDGAKSPEVFFTLGGQVRYDPLTMEIMNSSPPSRVPHSSLAIFVAVVSTLWAGVV
ncbi:contactin [Plakobranchus ocellatus]|uniref:Contactin n=1 Tax=Plakobranchus ocellatus TaxID=259542 RepID=A0AAV3ZLA8_9GAST|nr:contactin [Plakobranchus ocellatus]